MPLRKAVDVVRDTYEMNVGKQVNQKYADRANGLNQKTFLHIVKQNTKFLRTGRILENLGPKFSHTKVLLTVGILSFSFFF